MSLQLEPPSVLSCHCSVGVGVPVTATVNCVLSPAMMLTLTGWVVNTGAAVAALTVSVAGLLVMLPVTLLTTTWNWCPLLPSGTAVRFKRCAGCPSNVGKAHAAVRAALPLIAERGAGCGYREGGVLSGRYGQVSGMDADAGSHRSRGHRERDGRAGDGVDGTGDDDAVLSAGVTERGRGRGVARSRGASYVRERSPAVDADLPLVAACIEGRHRERGRMTRPLRFDPSAGW